MCMNIVACSVSPSSTPRQPFRATVKNAEQRLGHEVPLALAFASPEALPLNAAEDVSKTLTTGFKIVLMTICSAEAYSDKFTCTIEALHVLLEITKHTDDKGSAAQHIRDAIEERLIEEGPQDGGFLANLTHDDIVKARERIVDPSVILSRTQMKP